MLVTACKKAYVRRKEETDKIATTGEKRIFIFTAEGLKRR
jgi:hypothetical protein